MNSKKQLNQEQIVELFFWSLLDKNYTLLNFISQVYIAIYYSCLRKSLSKLFICFLIDKTPTTYSCHSIPKTFFPLILFLEKTNKILETKRYVFIECIQFMHNYVNDLEKQKNRKIFFFLLCQALTNYQNSYILDISAERFEIFF